MKMRNVYGVLMVLGLALSGSVWAATEAEVAGRCMTCHKEQSPGLYQQWYNSQHAIQGDLSGLSQGGAG
jgi:hypothetical protein